MARSICDLALVVGATALLAASPGRAQNPTNAGSPTITPPSAQPIVRSPDSPIKEILEPREEGREREERRDEIETDRDSFTPSTRTVGRHRLVVESAWSFIDNRGFKETNSVPELLLRYGATDRIEVRLGFNYEVGGAPGGVTGSEGGLFNEGRSLERESNISYGLKFWVTKQNGLIPDSVFIAQAFTPTSGNDTATQVVLTYAWGWELANGWKLDSAIRRAEDSEAGDRFATWAPSVVLKVPFWEQWAAHVEYFGEFSSNKREEFTKHFISSGLHYLINEDFEVGIRLGWGLNDQSARFFSNIGFGVRF